MRTIRTILLLFLLAAALTATAHAEEAVSDGASVEAVGFAAPQRLSDGDRSTYTAAGADNAVTVSREGGVASLYVVFDRVPQPWTAADPHTGTALPCGEHGFLHEFVDVRDRLGTAPETLTLTFPEGTVIADIYAFSGGGLPDWVQVWEPPCEEADLLLLSSHSDDEQLFFAGVLPYYAVERDLRVQVVYLVQHFEAYGQQDHRRPHEQLDGLWTVGVHHYPLISRFPDLYSESKDRATALSRAKAVYQGEGFSYDDFVSFLTGCLRRFRPLVVVSHDLDGEYGHGTHVLCADALSAALQAAPDPERYPDSAADYGVWEVEKTYLHLYDQGQIRMDWDTPLDSLGGKTPFQMTQEGFRCHASQHWTWFYKWIYGTQDAPIQKATDIRTYSPCLYGLFDTTVGADEAGGDFFEHVTTYAQREAEAARLAAEEAERLAAEEAARAAEAERLAAQEAAEAREAAEAARTRTGKRAAAWAGVGLCAGLIAGVLFRRRRKG